MIGSAGRRLDAEVYSNRLAQSGGPIAAKRIAVILFSLKEHNPILALRRKVAGLFLFEGDGFL